MDDFFQKLNTLSSWEDQVEAIKTGRQKLREINEGLRLDFAWKLLKWAERRYHTKKYAEEIINDVLGLAEKTATEEAALLLLHKAYYDFDNSDISEATHYADLALKKSRDIGSNKAESESLILKAVLSEKKLEHKKTNAWYTMALAKCSKLQRPGHMLRFGISLRMQGEYSQALSFFYQAKSLASNLSNDLSLDDAERTKCKRTVIESYEQLGIVHEGLGDPDGAFRAYDKGRSLNKGFKFKSSNFMGTIEVIDTPRTKTEATQPKAGEMLNEGSNNDSTISYSKANGIMGLLIASKQYEDALMVSRKVLFEDIIDSRNDFSHLNYIMENQTFIFSSILQAIAICLHATGRIVESETINKEEALFIELKQQTGLVNKADRNYKLLIQKKRLIAILRQVLFKIPDLVEYKNIQAKYDPVKEKATFKIGEKEIIKRKVRYFLVFKCLVENAGEKVSGEMLDDFVIKQGENINKDDSGLRVYVGRLIKDINLAQFLVPHGGKGWMLQAP